MAVGHGGAVLGEGEPGIGKSALPRAGLAAARAAGCQVFHADGPGADPTSAAAPRAFADPVFVLAERIQARTLATRVSAHRELNLALNAAGFHYRAGRWDDALAELKAAATLPDTFQSADVLRDGLAALIAVRRGQLDQANAHRAAVSGRPGGGSAAGELSLSRRTVQTHVSHILAKLGMRSRMEVVLHRGELESAAGPAVG